VSINNDSLGWSSKPFEITKWDLVNKGNSKSALFGVNVTLRETATTIFDWADGEETVIDPSPDTNLPNPFAAPEAPSTVLVDSGNEGLFISEDGTVIIKMHVTWTDPTNTFLDHIETQSKVSSSGCWEQGPDVIDSQEVFLGPVSAGDNWDVRIRSVSSFRKVSAWVPVLNHLVQGKSAPPPDVSSFTFTQAPDGTRVYTWTSANPPPDLAGYKIRFFLGTTSDWDAMTDLHTTGLVSESPHEDNQLSAGTYTLAIKAVDTSGNLSVGALFVSNAALGDPRLREALISRNEAPLAWPGTLFNCNADAENALHVKHDAGLDWTDVAATWATLPSTWSSILTAAGPFYYTTPELDLGADISMTPLISIQGTGTPSFAMQTGTVSDGAVTGTVSITSSSVANPSNILAVGHGMVTSDLVQIDGHSVGGATPDINGFHTITRVDDDNYTIPVNVTVGGTGGSSIFFKPLGVEAIRYIKIRVCMAGADSFLTDLISIIDAPATVETFEDVDINSETAAWFNSVANPGRFQIGSKGKLSTIVQAQITAIQGANAGYTWNLVNKNSTVNGEVAAEFNIYDASQTLVNATVDITLRGAEK